MESPIDTQYVYIQESVECIVVPNAAGVVYQVKNLRSAHEPVGRTSHSVSLCDTILSLSLFLLYNIYSPCQSQPRAQLNKKRIFSLGSCYLAPRLRSDENGQTLFLLSPELLTGLVSVLFAPGSGILDSSYSIWLLLCVLFYQDLAPSPCRRTVTSNLKKRSCAGVMAYNKSYNPDALPA